jgi:hypothetical protein
MKFPIVLPDHFPEFPSPDSSPCSLLMMQVEKTPPVVLVVAPSSESHNMWKRWGAQHQIPLNCHPYNVRRVSTGELKTLVNMFQEKGGQLLKGSFDEVTPRALLPLKTAPSQHWFAMTSVTEEQLQVLKGHGAAGEALLFSSLIRHGWFGASMTTPNKGPSPVERRWTKVFPETMALAQTLRHMGVKASEALDLFHMHQSGSTLTPTIDLPSLG